MPHPRQPERFKALEDDLKRRVAEGLDPMRGMVEEMLLHVGWQAQCIEERVYHSKRNEPKDILALADEVQLFVLHRELAAAFVRISRVHGQLDCIAGKSPLGKNIVDTSALRLPHDPDAVEIETAGR